VCSAFWLAVSFAVLTLVSGFTMQKSHLSIPLLATGIAGIAVLCLATATFGIT